MLRFLAPILAGLLLASLPVRAADPPAGTWRMTFPVPTRNGEVNLSMLVMFSESEGKWVADFLDSNPPLGAEPTVDLTVKDDTVKFTIKFGPNTLSFDGKVNGKRIKGSLEVGGDMLLVDLVPSGLKSLTKDKFAAAREALDTSESPQDFFNSLFPVVGQAAAKKLKPEDVRAYADKASKLAESYGTRWQRTVAFRLADLLADQEPFAAIAVEQARQGERLLTRTDDIATQLQTLDTLARVLRKAKKDADAKDVESRLAKLEVRDYADYSKTNPPFKPDEYKGRKGKSDRAVLVELFTGADCGPCVAVDLAFDALGRTYKPTEVILLQYHEHIPGPDPLTSKDGSARFDFYAKKDDDKSTPQIYLNGKADASGGGAAKMAKLKYQAFREAIDDLLEKPAPVKLTLTASLKGDEITIKGTVADLEKPGDKVSLRFALAEERIRYTGGNGLRYHHAVVRAMPGGPKGFPLPKASAEQTLTVKLDQVRTENIKSLDDFAAELQRRGAGEFSFSQKPMALKNLRVVAFVQNDETNEVLQAVQVDLDAGKE